MSDHDMPLVNDSIVPRTDRVSTERLLAADPTEEWVADEWAHRSSESDRASAEGLREDARTVATYLIRSQNPMGTPTYDEAMDAFNRLRDAVRSSTPRGTGRGDAK